MSKYVAARRLRWGDGWIETGHPVPDGEPNRRYDIMLRTGEIQLAQQGAAAIAVAPAAPSIPSNLTELSKAQLWALAKQLELEEIEGSGSTGNVLKADLIAAIEEVRL